MSPVLRGLLPIGPELWGSCSVENVSVPWELQVLG